MNQRNFGIVEGRLAKDVTLRTNKDGSQRALITLVVQCNYKGSDGKYPIDFVKLEGLIPAESKNTVYNYLKKGATISAEYTIKSVQHEKDGQTLYTQCLFVQSIELKTETPRDKAHRLAKNKK